MSLSKEISAWIKNQVKESGAKGIVVGLSGGIDSACVAALAKMAVGDNMVGLIMPCHSSLDDEISALLAAKKIQIPIHKVDLSSVYDQFVGIIGSQEKVVIGNVKPRLRMITLYAFANKLNYLVAGTGNKSELTVGYFTKYGDGGVDILPLGDLVKSEVRQLAKELEIPDEIIARVPTAGLWHGQTDEGELGISYQDLDSAIKTIETGAKPAVSKEVIAKIKKLNRATEHKRVCAPIFRRSRRTKLSRKKS